MTLILLTPPIAAHYAIALRRYLAAWESVPGLPLAGRAEVDNLRAELARLDEVVKCGQSVHLVAGAADNRSMGLRVGEAAIAAGVSVKTLRRRLTEGAIPSRRSGHRIVIAADALNRWVEEGKPRGRAA